MECSRAILAPGLVEQNRRCSGGKHSDLFWDYHPEFRFAGHNETPLSAIRLSRTPDQNHLARLRFRAIAAEIEGIQPKHPPFRQGTTPLQPVATFSAEGGFFES